MLDMSFTRSKLLSAVPGLIHGFSNLGCDSKSLQEFAKTCATAKQVHLDNLLWIDTFEKAAREADGIGTSQKNLPVAVFTADCSPILFVALNAKQQAVACLALHAGWRGTAAKIADKALRLFASKTQPLGAQKISVAIGPSISRNAFEVGQEVIDAFPGAESKGVAEFIRIEEGKRKYLFDLPGENKRQLESVNIAMPIEIDQLPDCTYSEAARYPSYRREKGTQSRILSFIAFQ